MSIFMYTYIYIHKYIYVYFYIFICLNIYLQPFVMGIFINDKRIESLA